MLHLPSLVVLLVMPLKYKFSEDLVSVWVIFLHPAITENMRDFNREPRTYHFRTHTTRLPSGDNGVVGGGSECESKDSTMVSNIRVVMSVALVMVMMTLAMFVIMVMLVMEMKVVVL